MTIQDEKILDVYFLAQCTDTKEYFVISNKLYELGPFAVVTTVEGTVLLCAANEKLTQLPLSQFSNDFETYGLLLSRYMHNNKNIQILSIEDNNIYG